MSQKNNSLGRFAAGAALLLCIGAATGCEQLLGLDDDARRLDPNVGLEQCDSGCDDSNPCTVDACDEALGVCRHQASPDGLASELQQVEGDCRQILCSAGAADTRRDDQDIPVDTECGRGACVEGNATLLPLERGLSCGGGMRYCDGDGACVECLSDEHCELPSQCGAGGVPGTCGCTPYDCNTAGADGGPLTCGTASDGCYGELNCDNQARNGDETDVDCGGSLSGCARRCEAGLLCSYGTDCLSSFCAGEKCDGAWSVHLGDDAQQHVRAVAVDAAGNVVVVGEFTGELDFGNGSEVSQPGSWAVFVAKFDATGLPVWHRSYGDVNVSVTVNDAVIDGSDSIIVVGQFQGTINWGDDPMTSGQLPQGFVVKFDEQGYTTWSMQLSGGNGSTSSSDATAAALGSNATVLVAGHYDGTLNVKNMSQTSTLSRDAFVTKLNGAGTPLMLHSFGGPGQQRAMAVASYTNGDIALAGEYTGTISFGDQDHSSQGDWDAFVARLDDSGSHLWSQSYGDTAAQRATAVAFDSAGAVVVGGSYFGAIDLGRGPMQSAGAEDVFVAVVDQMGATLWADRYGDVQSQQLAELVVDPRNDIVLAGSFNGVVTFGGQLPLVSNGGPDVFIAKFDRQGGDLWSRRFGDAETQRATDLAVTDTGSLILVGDFRGSIDFGQGNFGSAGADDIFIAALPP